MCVARIRNVPTIYQNICKSFLLSATQASEETGEIGILDSVTNTWYHYQTYYMVNDSLLLGVSGTGKNSQQRVFNLNKMQVTAVRFSTCLHLDFTLQWLLEKCEQDAYYQFSLAHVHKLLETKQNVPLAAYLSCRFARDEQYAFAKLSLPLAKQMYIRLAEVLEAPELRVYFDQATDDVLRQQLKSDTEDWE